jgi:lipid II:glycine glycyltransferase (peptidoglycan interpeptide bridge formation enzyme)
MRGLPALRDGSDTEAPGYARSGHFYNFVLPLAGDVEAVRATFSQKAVRYMITKAEKAGVNVRRGDADAVDAFYPLYVATRRRHGIPPQPRRLFSRVVATTREPFQAILYLADYEQATIAAVITVRHAGVTYLKYEVSDDSHRNLGAVHALLWASIRDALLAGDHSYDFGRTAADNPGLCEFKKRWGTTQTEMPYYFDPPVEGVSVARTESLRYRLFTGAFRRMPAGLAVRIGERIFRHFG